MSGARTVIPLSKDDDDIFFEYKKVPFESFKSIINSISVCNTDQGMDQLHASRTYRHDEPIEEGADVMKKMLNIFRDHPDKHHFVFNKLDYFGNALCALIMWYLRGEERSLCVTLIDDAFIKAPDWSYRYYWRQLALEQQGLCIAEVENHLRTLSEACEGLGEQPGTEEN